jgi:hypothetical protein
VSSIPNIPASGTPVIDASGTQFSKPWFLFLAALTSAIGALSTGGGGTSANGYYVILLVLTGLLYSATPVLAQGSNQEVILIQPLVAIVTPTGGATSDIWTLYVVQDSAGGRLVTFDSGYAGNAALPGMLTTAANTYSALVFVIRPDGKSALTAITTGMPV